MRFCLSIVIFKTADRSNKENLPVSVCEMKHRKTNTGLGELHSPEPGLLTLHNAGHKVGGQRACTSESPHQKLLPVLVLVLDAARRDERSALRGTPPHRMHLL